MGKAFITTFTYECEIAFNSVDGTSTEILKDAIKYIIVEHDYRKAIMPTMYMKINVIPSVYNKMVPEQGKSKIYLKIYRTRHKGSTSSAPKKVIYDEFDYFMTDDPSGYKKLDTIGEEKGTAFKECFIGLIKLDLQKQNQRSFEGVYKNTNMASLVHNATSHMRMVMQPFVNNKTFSSFVCPTISTVGQFLSYLNSKKSFYNGSYTYFMDLDKTYLRSNDGSYIDAKDGDHKYIAFDIRDLTTRQALMTGMVEDVEQDAYIIYVPAQDAQITVDRVTSSLIGEVNAVDMKDGSFNQTANINTQYITNIGTAGSSLMHITEDPKGASNMATRVSENSSTLIITKVDMDSRVFTPNKQYLLCNYEDNPKYCGVYYMVGKKEIYLRNGNQMSCQMTITLKKCADFVGGK